MTQSPSIQGQWNPFFTFGDGKLPYVLPNSPQHEEAVGEPTLLVPRNIKALKPLKTPVGERYPRPTYRRVARRAKIEPRKSNAEMPRLLVPDEPPKRMDRMDRAKAYLQARRSGDPKILKGLRKLPDRFLEKHGIKPSSSSSSSSSPPPL